MLYHLQSRFLIKVQGADAAEFLQNTLTNDIRKITSDNPLQYNLLLSPQGQILHEMFVLYTGENEYVIDTFAPRKDDLLRRLTLFKLRAKVDLSPLSQGTVYATLDGTLGISDPRSTKLGARVYQLDGQAPAGLINDEVFYQRECIAQTIPTAEAIKFEKDFVHDLNLQKFNAIAWDKGCFIGQEVAARVEHRGLSKKSLFTVGVGSGRLDMANPRITLEDGNEAGELRLIDAKGGQGLAVLKKMAVESGQPLLNAGQNLQIGQNQAP